MFLLIPAYPGSLGPKAIKRLCVCVCVCVSGGSGHSWIDIDGLCCVHCRECFM